MTNLQTIEQHPVMKEILKDSFGGVMYNVANRNKYDSLELLAIWESMSAAEQEDANGLIRGAINFIKGN